MSLQRVFTGLLLAALMSSGRASAHPRSRQFLTQTVFFESGNADTSGYEQVAAQVRVVVSVCPGGAVRIDSQLVPGSLESMSPQGNVYWYGGKRRPVPPGFPFPRLDYGVHVRGTLLYGGTELNAFRTLALPRPPAEYCGYNADSVGLLPSGVKETDEGISEWLMTVSTQFEHTELLRNLELERAFDDEAREEARKKKEQVALAARAAAEAKRVEAERLRKEEEDREKAARDAAERAADAEPEVEAPTREQLAQEEELQRRAAAKLAEERAQAAEDAKKKEAQQRVDPEEERRARARSRSAYDQQMASWVYGRDRADEVPEAEIADDLEWLRANTVSTNRYGASERTVKFEYSNYGINRIGWHEITRVGVTDTDRVEVRWLTISSMVRVEYLTPRADVEPSDVAWHVYSAATTKRNVYIRRAARGVQDRDARYLEDVRRWNQQGKTYDEIVAEETAKVLIEGAFKVNWEAIASYADSPAPLFGQPYTGQSIMDLRLQLSTATRQSRTSWSADFAIPAITSVKMPMHQLLLPGGAVYKSGQYNVRFFSPSAGVSFKLYKTVNYEGTWPSRFQVPIAAHAGIMVFPASEDVVGKDDPERSFTVQSSIEKHFPHPGFHGDVSISAQYILGWLGIGVSAGVFFMYITPTDGTLTYSSDGVNPDKTVTFKMEPVSVALPYVSIKAILYWGGD